MTVDSTEKKGSVAITLPPDFNFLAARLRNGRTVQKDNWAFQVMQYIGNRDNIKTVVLDCV